MLAPIRRGFSVTVAVLAALGAIATAVAVWLLPGSSLPRPPGSSVEVDFSSEHPANTPTSIDVQLSSTPSFSRSTRENGADLTIYLSGSGLSEPGWSIYAVVPSGVKVFGIEPGTAHVGHYPNSNGMSSVYVTPGPARGGTYTVILAWDDLRSGPMQVDGPDLTATFPDITVDNQGVSDPPPQAPPLTVMREIVPFGDFAYLGGVPPDQLSDSAWSWKGRTFPVNGGSGMMSTGLETQAKSASVDAQSHAMELYSGIAFGVAAGAAIGAIQEFVKTATKGEA